MNLEIGQTIEFIEDNLIQTAIIVRIEGLFKSKITVANVSKFANENKILVIHKSDILNIIKSNKLELKEQL